MQKQDPKAWAKSMRKLHVIIALLGIAAFLTSCGGNKQVVQTDSGSKSPFGDVYEAPCTVYDTPEEFAATGIYRGSMNQKGEAHKFALQNAQSIVRMKIKHAYEGMVSEFSQSIGSNQGNDIETKISQAGDQIIDVVVNNTSESCLRYGTVGDDGHIECYVAIKISKEDLSQKITNTVENKLTEEEKMKIGFDEMKYREQMEKKFKEYKSAN